MAVKKVSKAEHPTVYEPLPPEQERTIDLLMNGTLYVEVAETVGVSPKP